MSWVTITSDDFKGQLLANEKAAVDAASLPEGKTAAELLAECIVLIVAKVRMRCPNKDQLGPEGTIPEGLKIDALALLTELYFSRASLIRALWTDQRNQRYLQALEALKLWGRGEMRSQTTEAPAEDQGGGPAVEALGAQTSCRPWEDGHGLWSLLCLAVASALLTGCVVQPMMTASQVWLGASIGTKAGPKGWKVTMPNGATLEAKTEDEDGAGAIRAAGNAELLRKAAELVK